MDPLYTSGVHGLVGLCVRVAVWWHVFVMWCDSWQNWSDICRWCHSWGELWVRYVMLSCLSRKLSSGNTSLV